MKGVRYQETNGKRSKEMKKVNEGGKEGEQMREGWESDGGIDLV